MNARLGGAHPQRLVRMFLLSCTFAWMGCVAPGNDIRAGSDADPEPAGLTGDGSARDSEVAPQIADAVEASVVDGPVVADEADGGSVANMAMPQASKMVTPPAQPAVDGGAMEAMDPLEAMDSKVATCDALRMELNELAEESSGCSADADCQFVMAGRCDLACGVAVNSESGVEAHIGDIVRDFYDGGCGCEMSHTCSPCICGPAGRAECNEGVCRVTGPS